MNVNHTELFLLIATRPYGEQIAVRKDGSITIHDDSLILRDQDDIVAVLKAEGDYDRSGWGVSRYEGDDESIDGFVVDGIEGKVFDSDADALVAAVGEFGLRAEDIEELDRLIDEEKYTADTAQVADGHWHDPITRAERAFGC